MNDTATATRTEKMDPATLINMEEPRPKGKREAYVMLCKIVEGLDDTEDKGRKAKLSSLLRYFETNPKARAGKDAFAWMAQAVSTDKTRLALTVVSYDDENVVATDGHRLHIMPNTGERRGFYTAQGQPEIEGPTYPNYKQIIPDTTGRARVVLKLAELTVDHVSQGLDVCEICGGLYELKFIKEALAFDGEAVAFIPALFEGVPDGPIALEMGEGRRAFVMPRRRA